jgi:hypothetical protein
VCASRYDVAQILFQDHTGFGVWLGDPFHDKESEQFVARYIKSAPSSLEKLSLQDDIVTYTTKDGAAHEFDTLEFLAALSVHIPKTYESITRYYGRDSSRRRGERAKLFPLPAEEQESDYRRESSVGVVGPRASSASTKLIRSSAPHVTRR